MRHARLVAALPPLLGLLAACGSDTEPVPLETPRITLSWEGADSEFCTSGVRVLQAKVEGDVPEQVELVKDDERIGTLSAPYTVQVDCDVDPEGSHTFRLRARRAGATFLGPAKTLRIDRTAPSLTGTTPAAASSQDVRRDTPITFQFSEPVKGDFSTATTLSADGVPLAHTATLSEDGRVLTLVPEKPLPMPAILRATLSGSGITDAHGLPLVQSSAELTWELLPFIRAGSELLGVVTTAIARGPSGTPWMVSNSLDSTGYAVSRWTPQGWTAFGTTLSVEYAHGLLALALDASESPVLAAFEAPAGREGFVRVSRWKDGAWQQVGGTLDGASGDDFVRWLSVDVDSRGNPTVAWHEGFSVHVRRWTGTEWETLGTPIGKVGTDTANPALQIDSQDRAVLAYSEEFGDDVYEHVVVQRWEGNAWAPIGASLAVGQTFSINAVDLELGPGDAPVVAWVEDASARNVHAARWTQSGWLVTPILGTTYLEDMSLAVDTDGRALVAWWNGPLDQRQVYTARFENDQWSTGVKSCYGDDPLATFGPDGTPMLWVRTESALHYQAHVAQ